ncbi:MAG: hypothetical protein ACM3IJ_00290 [Candidatus Levyibacteriota bacterium]
MVERSVPKPKELAQKLKEAPRKDKAFMVAETIAGSLLLLYALSTVDLLRMQQFDEAGASALDTLRMGAVTSLVVASHKLSNTPRFMDWFTGKNTRQNS